MEELLAAEPGELAARFHITREDGTPVARADLPGARVLAGEERAPCSRAACLRATGAERWLLTKATRLEDGEPFSVNIIEDITEAKNAELRRRLLAEAGALLAATGADAARPASPRCWSPRSPTGARSISATDRSARGGSSGASGAATSASRSAPPERCGSRPRPAHGH